MLVKITARIIQAAAIIGLLFFVLAVISSFYRHLSNTAMEQENQRAQMLIRTLGSPAAFLEYEKVK